MKFQITVSITFILATLLAACSSAPLPYDDGPGLTPTERVITQQPLPVQYLPRSQSDLYFILPEEAVLYSGPGDVDFDPIATLPAGSEIFPLGTYVDFVEAMAVVNGSEVTGYLLKKALGALPSTIPILQSDQVPWKPLYSPACTPGVYDPATRTTRLTSSNDIATNQIHLDAPCIYGWMGCLTHMVVQDPSKFSDGGSKLRMDIWSENGYYILGFEIVIHCR